MLCTAHLDGVVGVITCRKTLFSQSTRLSSKARIPVDVSVRGERVEKVRRAEVEEAGDQRKMTARDT